MLKSNRINENQLEFQHHNIKTPIILGVVFAIIGGFITYQGLQTDWSAMDENTALLAFGLVFLVGGISGAIFGPRTHTYLFNKEDNRVSYECKKMSGTEESTFPMEGITRLVVTKKRQKSSNDSSSKKITYTYQLEYESGDTVEIGKVNKKYRKSVLASSSVRPEAIEELASFLDIPIKEFGFKDVVNEMKNTLTDLMAEKESEKT